MDAGMSNPERDSADFVRSMVLGLSVECPYGGCPEDCGLCDVRKKSMRERYEWMKQLTEQQCHEVYAAHRNCWRHRLWDSH